MMDFFRVAVRETKAGPYEIFPDFVVAKTKDLMVRGKGFYAIWDQENEVWSTDEFNVPAFIDRELWAERDRLQAQYPDRIYHVKAVQNFSNSMWLQFRSYLNHISDSYHPLDQRLTFASQEVKRSDFISKRLSYDLEVGDHSSYDEMISTLYEPEERQKLEWAIGSIVAGDSRDIQKFIVLYGEPGSGKGTVLNIIRALFDGYCEAFEARALGQANATFAMEPFRDNPLVAYQQDGDLSKIEDNTRLNSIISHETMTMNEKFKSSYSMHFDSMLFMGTNKPVRISDSNSGIIRRLIDVRPSGRKLPPKKYQALMSKMQFELGSIAQYCLDVYLSMGKDFYFNYRAIEMALQTDIFYNYIEFYYDDFSTCEGVTLNRAYEMYKEFCTISSLEHVMPRHIFRDELRNYFDNFEERAQVDGQRRRSWYYGFRRDRFAPRNDVDVSVCSLVLDQTYSLLDEVLAEEPAQYANANDTPTKKWAQVTTVLADLDTTKTHYVKVPANHIVIDFDLKDDNGEKSAERNLEAASKWPPTYAEFSKGGNGVHLHYNYTGDPSKLARVFDEGIEIKVFSGDSSLRRRVSLCNNVPVSPIGSGLPLKEEKVINSKNVESELGLRALILRNLHKEIHPGTKPSVDFIWKILDDAHKEGFPYDVTDMRPDILVFAMNSTHQADYCVKLVNKMQFKSETEQDEKAFTGNDEIVFFDCEVFQNLLVISWKIEGPEHQVVNMINPSAEDIGELFKMKLVGFNCRKYDNHILYGAYMGFNNEALFKLSQRIISNSPNATFAEAYGISYTDIYDLTSKKQSLKKYEIELGIHHQELGLPWDEPVADEMIALVAQYCGNDVLATEATWNARQGDWAARQILAQLSGLTVNDTTQKHAARIILGTDRKAQDKFVYTDLSKEFPGYTYEFGKSTYCGEEVGEGGLVRAHEGVYYDVALLDITSMHPSSIEALNAFGPYTKNFSNLKAARIAVKHNDIPKASELLGKDLSVFCKTDEDRKSLAYALKIVINIVYGLTSAKFDNPFKDPRNVDNIVAKRGALFMIDLKNHMAEMGVIIVHIKTDSVKIPNATPEIIEEVINFGKKYSYNFEHEATYSRMCLVNDAVYIARYATEEKCKKLYGYAPEENQEHGGEWTATGTQFAVPYVFKTLFSKEDIEPQDLTVTKTVTTALYLNFGTEEEPQMHFVGKAGLFVPVRDHMPGGILVREKEGKFYAASGTKGYRWMEAEVYKTEQTSRHFFDDIDVRYFNKLYEDARAAISQYEDVDTFIEGAPDD